MCISASIAAEERLVPQMPENLKPVAVVRQESLQKLSTASISRMFGNSSKNVELFYLQGNLLFLYHDYDDDYIDRCNLPQIRNIVYGIVSFKFFVEKIANKSFGKNYFFMQN